MHQQTKQEKEEVLTCREVEKGQSRAQISLKRYAELPFLFLFKSGNDQVLLNCCAVDHRVFQNVLQLFKPVDNQYTVNKNTGAIQPVVLTKHGKPKRRRRELDAIGCLVLLLYWFQTLKAPLLKQAHSDFRRFKIANFGTNVCLSAGFFTKFHVGCSTNCTQTCV